MFLPQEKALNLAVFLKNKVGLVWWSFNGRMAHSNCFMVVLPQVQRIWISSCANVKPLMLHWMDRHSSKGKQTVVTYIVLTPFARMFLSFKNPEIWLDYTMVNVFSTRIPFAILKQQKCFLYLLVWFSRAIILVGLIGAVCQECFVGCVNSGTNTHMRPCHCVGGDLNTTDDSTFTGSHRNVVCCSISQRKLMFYTCGCMTLLCRCWRVALQSKWSCSQIIDHST